MADMAGHDINYIGLTGVLHAIGGEDPTPPLNLIGDYAGGALYAVIGILGALVEANETGTGTVVDAAMVDGSAALLAPIRALAGLGMWSESRRSNLLDGGAPFYRTYRTSDGRYMAVGALEPAFYAELLEGLDLDPSEIPDRRDPTSWDALADVFSGRFAERTQAEWTEVFDGTDACVTPVLAMSQADEHPHNVARGAVVDGAHGGRPAPAPRFVPFDDVHESRYRDGISVADTLVGLGVDEASIERLARTGRSYRW